MRRHCTPFTWSQKKKKRYKKAKRMLVTVIASIPNRMPNARTSHMNSNKFWTFNNFFVAFLRSRFSVFAFAAPKNTHVGENCFDVYEWICGGAGGERYRARDVQAAWIRSTDKISSLKLLRLLVSIYLFNLHLKEVFRNMNNACTRWIWINHRLLPSTPLHHSD